MKWTTSCAERGVELVVRVRKLLGGGETHRDRGMALLRGRDEALRRIDGAHGRRSHPPDELGRQRTRTATDIHHPLSVADGGEVREQWGKRPGVPAHEAVVGVGTDVEAHVTP